MAQNRERANLWLAAKVPGASFNPAGIASIQRDTDTQVVLELSSSEDLCHFCAIVAPLDDAEPEANLMAALELNRFGKPLGGCWIAWEPELQMLTLCWNMELANADQLAFSNAIDNFIAAFDSARNELIPQTEDSASSALLELA
jgi:hypothetical protein